MTNTQKLRTLIFTLITFLLCVSVSHATEIITCEVDRQGKTLFKGKCLFTAQSGGSFYLSGKNISRNIGAEGMMVWIDAKNTAFVQSIKFNGGVLNWGKATRSNKQKACWVGDYFKVCAWK